MKKELIEQLAAEFAELKRTLFRPVAGQLDPGISQAQGELLFMVAKHKGITMSHIAKELKMSGGAATQLVDALIAHGLLERQQDKKDRRITHLVLSKKADRQISKLRADYLKNFYTTMEKLSVEDLRILISLIKKITTAK